MKSKETVEGGGKSSGGGGERVSSSVGWVVKGVGTLGRGREGEGFWSRNWRGGLRCSD